jgi:hypothetical protein
MMGRRCCCVQGGCEIGEDTFTRSDSTNLGSDWDELSGSWEIKDNELHCTSDGIALWVKKNISSRQWPSFVVEVDLPNVVVGCVYGIVVNSDDEGTNYHWCKYTPSTPGEGELGGTLAIGKGASTIATLNLIPIATSSPNTDRLIMCLGESAGSGNGILSASLDSYDQAIWTPDVDVIEYYGYCGLYGEPSDGDDPAEFDNFEASEAWWSNSACPTCFCRCYDSGNGDHRVLPMTLKLIWNVDGDNQTLIDCFDQVEVTLTWDDAAEEWQGEMNPNPCADVCSGSGFDVPVISFRLECANETKTSHMLHIELDEQDLYSDTMFAESSSDCNPLSLIFNYRDLADVACEEDEDDSQIWFEVVEP